MNASHSIVSNPKYLGASQPFTAVSFAIPSKTCDCLTHVFGDPARYPMAPGRPYTPELASIGELQALHKALHVERVVVVQTTVYGTDNSCMLEALKKLGSSARGIAVIDDKTPAAELDRMDRAGVRGIRINLETVGITDPSVARKQFLVAVERIRDRTNWHIQIYTRLSVIEALYDMFESSPVPVSLDHFAGTQAANGMPETGFSRLLELLKLGKVYVKLSAPELVSKLGPNYPDVEPLARALISANRNQILWASHWPHPDSFLGHGRSATEVNPLRQIDDGHVFNLLQVWAPDDADRHAILVDNPARLYGF